MNELHRDALNDLILVLCGMAFVISSTFLLVSA